MTNLFDYMVGVSTVHAKTLCHKSDPDTSREAAQKMVESEKLQRQERLVFRSIKNYLEYNQKENFTPKEVGDDSELGYFTIQRRLSGLYRKGKIKRTGQKRNGCAVWRLA